MKKIKSLSIDIETFSDIDLRKSGVYRYSESDIFEIILFAVAVDNGPVVVYDLASGENLPEWLLDAIVSDDIIKWAFNANFERVCISNWLKGKYPTKFKSYTIDGVNDCGYLNPVSWRCTLVWSAYMGLPLSLEGVGAVLGLEEQKMKEGKELIRYFSCPCKPTKANGGRLRNLPTDSPTKWQTFKSYNKRDVEVEIAIKEKLSRFPVPDFIWDEYHIDQEINDRGIRIDLGFVKNAIAFDEKSRATIVDRIKKITGLENPNSVMQMREWLKDHGLETDSLDKKSVANLIKTSPKELSEVLRLRQMLAKSSVKKYQAMENCICCDGRARGMFMFYGANRSGRWAGRLIQLQNLPQNHMTDLKEARELIRQGDYSTLELLYDDIPDTLSQLIRTAFIPKEGCRFYVADFSSIEARVLSYLAGEDWRNAVFKEGKDIYCASAEAMFHVKVVKNGINGHLRQKGKIAELALGYGGSVGALKAMGALDMGLSEEELQPLVDAWRTSNPNIVKFWWDIDNAVKDAIVYKILTEVRGIKFIVKSGMLFIHLPSGRTLSYVKPRIGDNQFGGESITYEGTGIAKKWERIESYGPKFVENIVQAISRDLLMNALKTLRNCSICGHVHDEVIIEANPEVSLEAICNQMGRSPSWMPSILLRADGYVTDFYKKE